MHASSAVHKASTVWVMVSRFLLPEDVTSEQVFRYLANHDAPVFWLDSGDSATSGKSYLGLASSSITCAPGEEVTFLDQLRPTNPQSRLASRGFREPEFTLGWVGWLSYEFGLRLLGITPQLEEPVSAVMLRVSVMIEIDHRTGQASLVAEDAQSLSSWLERHLRGLLTFRPAVPDASSALRSEIRWRVGEAEYLDRVLQCQEAIRRGDAYLLCLTTQASIDVHEDPVEIYLRLRREHATHHGGFLRSGDTTLLSVSPERFLAVDANGNAQTKPIKGTRPRGLSPEGDAEMVRELATSEKEKAENLMIVDLMRNDFARVCAPETVQVTALHEIEQYPRVHQMVSTVTGTLLEQRDALDLLASCFPAGSMTGTPKRSSVELLHELEASPRGVYSGCFGYLSNDGSVDLAMVIRSIVITGHRASVGAGGGITSESVASAEYAEMLLKAQALLDALLPSKRPVV